MKQPGAVGKQVLSALRRKDTAQARALLDMHGQSMRPGSLAQFQAQIALAEKTPQKAVDLLCDQYGPSPEQPQIAILLAQAYMSLGNPDAAAQAIANAADDPTPRVVKMRLSVLAATKDRSALLDLARWTLTNLEGNSAVQEYAIRCVQKALGLEVVLELLGSTPVEGLTRKTGLTIVALAIRGGESGTVARVLDQLPQNDQLPMTALRSISVKSLDRPLSEIEDILKRVADQVEDDKSLVALAQICLHFNMVEFGKALFERGRQAYDPRDFPVLADRNDLNREETDHLMSEYQRVMDWLGVAKEDRRSWVARVSVGKAFHDAYRFYSLISPGYLPSSVQRRVREDLQPLRRLNARGGAGIVATSHIGFILSNLDYFHDNNIDVTVIGGHVLRQLCYPGGDRLNPVQEAGTSTGYNFARIAASTLRNNRLLATAVDVGHDSPIKFMHHGVTLNLHPTVSRLALRYNVPVTWIGSYIVGSELRCVCTELPSRKESESDDAYTARLMTACADRMRDACLADPINAFWTTRSIIAEPWEGG